METNTGQRGRTRRDRGELSVEMKHANKGKREKCSSTGFFVISEGRLLNKGAS